VDHDQLTLVAELLARRNEIDRDIAAVIKRPMTAGHLGEWIAAYTFDIQLEDSAVATAIDGVFRSGQLAGRTVNVKWYLKREGLLDMTTSDLLDYYLVLTGPPSAAASSRGATRPWRIDNVYLFDAHRLLHEQRKRGVSTGTASSVRKSEWTGAEIYPASTNPILTLSEEQVRTLRLFADDAG
jgi:hypothetical protein